MIVKKVISMTKQLVKIVLNETNRLVECKYAPKSSAYNGRRACCVKLWDLKLSENFYSLVSSIKLEIDSEF